MWYSCWVEMNNYFGEEGWMRKIEVVVIGVVHSPYRAAKEIPIQGRFKDEAEAWVELGAKYKAGLKDLDGFSHAILIYHFHLSNRETLLGQPYLEKEKHGIFAIRSPHRPNHLGLSVVRIKRIVNGTLHFTEVDLLDGTPILDIKPYVKYFDNRDNVKSGWLEKHFMDGRIPDNTILR